LNEKHYSRNKIGSQTHDLQSRKLPALPLIVIFSQSSCLWLVIFPFKLIYLIIFCVRQEKDFLVRSRFTQCWWLSKQLNFLFYLNSMVLMIMLWVFSSNSSVENFFFQTRIIKKIISKLYRFSLHNFIHKNTTRASFFFFLYIYNLNIFSSFFFTRNVLGS